MRSLDDNFTCRDNCRSVRSSLFPENIYFAQAMCLLQARIVPLSAAGFSSTFPSSQPASQPSFHAVHDSHRPISHPISPSASGFASKPKCTFFSGNRFFLIQLSILYTQLINKSKMRHALIFGHSLFLLSLVLFISLIALLRNRDRWSSGLLDKGVTEEFPFRLDSTLKGIDSHIGNMGSKCHISQAATSVYIGESRWRNPKVWNSK